MLKRAALGMMAALLIAITSLFFSGCAQTCHKAVYQDGKLLGEWDMERASQMGMFRTPDERRVLVILAPGIPLDTVTVGGGVAVVTVKNK